MRNNKETLAGAYKLISKQQDKINELELKLKNQPKPKLDTEEIIKIVRDIITLSFVNKLYGKK